MSAACLLVLFLAVRAEHQAATHPPSLKVGEVTMKRGPVQPRSLTTFFGVVRYARLYLRRPNRGSTPCDRALGLTTDRFSLRTPRCVRVWPSG